MLVFFLILNLLKIRGFENLILFFIDFILEGLVYSSKLIIFSF